MPETKRQSPKALKDKEMRRKPVPAARDPRDIMHDDRGVGAGRGTEDDQIEGKPEGEGWNSNT
ncbi:MAG TPA: hypothetical protein VJQ77_06750 [Novosphingobium sp.]|nr:hypothetical protein [Novosphingobium sp.]